MAVCKDDGVWDERDRADPDLGVDAELLSCFSGAGWDGEAPMI